MVDGRTLSTLCLGLLLTSGCLGTPTETASTETSNPPPSDTLEGDVFDTTGTTTAGQSFPDGSRPAIQASLTKVAGTTPGPFNFTLTARFGEDQEAPTQLSWHALLSPASGDPAENEAKGTSLPVNFSFNLANPGPYTILAQVESPGFNTGNASLEFQVLAAAPAKQKPLFHDGAENGTGAWTLSSDVFGGPLAFANGPGGVAPPPQANGQNPLIWSTTAAEAHTGTNSWTAPYYNALYADLISPPVTLDIQPHHLTFWLKGGVENNTNMNLDGLHVEVIDNGQSTEIHYVSDDFPEWTQFTVPLKGFGGKTIQIDFSFKSDVGCSAGDPKQVRDSFWGVVGPQIFGVDCGDSSYAGYFVDDIAIL